VTGVTWFITMSRARRIGVPSQTMQSFSWLHYHCLDGMAKVSRCATNILINRHKVTVHGGQDDSILSAIQAK
jgi:hypothetical protein